MLARDLRRQVPATKYVGTAVRLMFGGDIAVSARAVGDVAAAVTEMIELDLSPNGLWDNDQVVFRYVENPNGSVNDIAMWLSR